MLTHSSRTLVASVTSGSISYSIQAGSCTISGSTISTTSSTATCTVRAEYLNGKTCRHRTPFPTYVDRTFSVTRRSCALAWEAASPSSSVLKVANQYTFSFSSTCPRSPSWSVSGCGSFTDVVRSEDSTSNVTHALSSRAIYPYVYSKVIHFSCAGTVTVDASQPGDGYYWTGNLAAVSSTVTLNSNFVSWTLPTSRTYGAALSSRSIRGRTGSGDATLTTLTSSVWYVPCPLFFFTFWLGQNGGALDD